MSGIPHRPAGKETPISKPECPAEIPAVRAVCGSDFSSWNSEGLRLCVEVVTAAGGMPPALPRRDPALAPLCRVWERVAPHRGCPGVLHIFPSWCFVSHVGIYRLEFCYLLALANALQIFPLRKGCFPPAPFGLCPSMGVFSPNLSSPKLKDVRGKKTNLKSAITGVWGLGCGSGPWSATRCRAGGFEEKAMGPALRAWPTQQTKSRSFAAFLPLC